MPKPKGGTNCAVAVCKNRYYSTKGLKEYIGYHRFPKDYTLRKLWMDRCMRKDLFNADTSYVCSEHFELDDFERNFMSEFGLCKKKDVLKKDAVPTLKLTLNGRSFVKGQEELNNYEMSRGGCQCSVVVCKNRSTKTRTRIDSPVSYYVFPKDPTLRELWIRSCGREGHWNPSTSRICSEHFSPDQFEDDMQARIMGLRRAKKLKSGAFPTLKLNLTEGAIENKQKSLKRKRNSVPTGREPVQPQIKRERIDDLEESTDFPPCEPEVEIIEVIKYESKQVKFTGDSDIASSNPSSSPKYAPHCLECPFLEENKCLKAEVASLRAKLKQCGKKLDSSKKKNAALEIALMKCLTLKATPP